MSVIYYCLGVSYSPYYRRVRYSACCVRKARFDCIQKSFVKPTRNWCLAIGTSNLMKNIPD